MNGTIGIIGGADGPTAVMVGMVSTPIDFTVGTIIAFVACVIAAYFLGNISPAILIGRAYGIDIKKEGSGNAGTTNVLRVLGKKAAAATLVIDILKGVIAVLLGRFVEIGFGGDGVFLATVCGIAVMCGHIWPACFKFKGGKGVATAFGVLVTISPALGFATLGVVIAVIAITRRVSPGSIIGALFAPFFAYLFVPGATGGVCIMAILVIVKHRANIKRILKGEEPKISFKK